MQARWCALVLALVVCVLSTSTWSAPAWGQQTSAHDRAAAQALFDEALVLREAGQIQQACAKLDESLRLDPGVGTRFNLADCYVRIGKVASAWTHFLEVAAATEMAGQPERADVARRRAKELEPRLSRMRIVVAEPVEGLHIGRNGVDVGRAQWDTAVPVDPGEYAIVAEAPGYARWSTNVEVVGDAQNVVVEIPALEEAPEPEIDPVTGVVIVRDEGIGGMGIAGIVVGVVGLAGVGIGAGFGVVAMNKKKQVEEQCPDLNRCTEVGIQTNDEGKTAGNVSTAGFVAGGVLTATGVVLLAVALSGDQPAEPTQAGAWLLPAVGLEGAGLTVGGRF